MSSPPVEGDQTSRVGGPAGVTGTNISGIVVEPIPAPPRPQFVAGWLGVEGSSKNGIGVYGTTTGVFTAGVWGEANSKTSVGVYGISHATQAGVSGYNDAPSGAAAPGAYGESANWQGVAGVSHSSGAGVNGYNDQTGPGIWGESKSYEGVHGLGHAGGAGVSGVNDGPANAAGPGVYGTSTHGQAGHFDGDVQVTGTLTGVNAHHTGALTVDGAGSFGGNVAVAGTLNGVNAHHTGKLTVGGVGSFGGDVAVVGSITVGGNINIGNNGDVVFGDCAEQFDAYQDVIIEPGTVAVITGEGELEPSKFPYDSAVAGVISGAGDLRPALILGRQQTERNRAIVALVGKVYCKVDADYASIEVGDLLTTSPTLGHAMKAEDPARAPGSVIGKALQAMKAGRGLIPILIALQ